MTEFQKSLDHRDFEDRYPKRNRKSKNSSLAELDYINKAERLSSLPYDIEEITTSAEFEHNDVIKNMEIENFTNEYIKRTGLCTPLFFNEPPERLGMRMPDPENFTIDDVLDCIGAQRKIEVVEVYEQKGQLMKLGEFIDYYKKPAGERKELLNVLSLEFSSTRLADLVSAPKFVGEIDWIDNVWPKELFERQKNVDKSEWAKESDLSTYPKVQRYCLMSVARCFTDYHIDFGGTSVWYHILKGEKIFWLIEPTEANLKLYEEWILGGSENTGFFGKVVNKCTRIHLKRGNTLIIPSGWIHCVYTPCDSLVFGGNFLHSFSIPMQIRVSRSEDRIKIGKKYRFPHERQIFWCYIAQTVKFATGRVYQKPPTMHAHLPKKEEEKRSENSEKFIEENDQPIKVENEEEALKMEQNEDQREGDEICYDNFGNNEDGSFTYNPFQLKFNDQMKCENFEATKEYNIDYIQSLSPFEINGLYSLLPYAKRLLHSKQPEVIEGITRPLHLILELEQLLKKIQSMDLLNIEKEYELSPKTTLTDRTAEYKTILNSVERVQKDVKLQPKKSTKRHSLSDSFGTKNSKKMNKSSNGKPILVDGLPSAISSESIDVDLIPLGHKPIASAWRQSRQMAKPPHSGISNLKRKSSESQNASIENKIEPESSAEQNKDGQISLESIAQEKKLPKRIFKNIPRVAKLLENHDDSPELAHKSPLQRYIPDPKPRETSIHQHSNNGNDFRRESSSFSFHQKYPRQRSFDDGDDRRQRQWRPPYSNNNQNSYGRGRGYNRQNQSYRGNYRGSWRNQNRQDRPERSRNDPFDNPSDPFTNSGDPFSAPNPFNSNSPTDSAKRTSFGQQSSDERTNSFTNSMTTSMENTAEEDMEMDMDIEDQQEMMENNSQMRTMNQSGMEPNEYSLQPQPMNIAANELHHISQIMNNPVAGDFLIEQIPLPPSPRRAAGSNNAEMENSKPIDVADAAQGFGDAFAEADELANLTQLFNEQN